MKYLLSILILFSGLSFAITKEYAEAFMEEIAKKNQKAKEILNSYNEKDILLICDSPFIFYPDLKARKLFNISTSIDEGLVTFYEPTQFGSFHLDIIFYPKFEVDKVTLEFSYFFNYVIDRTTLEVENSSIKCKKVDKTKYKKAESEMEEYALEQEDKKQI